MTQEEFTLGATSVVRHLLTVGAGVLAAHGLAGGDQLLTAGSAVAVFAATMAWSWLEKSKLLAQLCENLPLSELESLGRMIAQFRGQGSNPLLIANIANTAMAVANQELIAAHPELAPKAVAPAAVPEPAPASTLSPASGQGPVATELTP